MDKKHNRQVAREKGSLKDDTISHLWRTRGNAAYKIEKYERSLECYTKAVLYAKKTSPCYPLALANRSASLVKLEKFQVRKMYHKNYLNSLNY